MCDVGAFEVQPGGAILRGACRGSKRGWRTQESRFTSDAASLTPIRGEMGKPLLINGVFS